MGESSRPGVSLPPKLGIRLLAAAVLVPGFIYIAHVGDWIFATAVAVVTLRLLWEFERMSRERGGSASTSPERASGTGGVSRENFFLSQALPILAILFCFWRFGLTAGLVCFTALVLFGYCIEAIRGRIQNATARVGERMIILFYLGVLPGHWILLRELPLEVGLPYIAGKHWALFGAGITWLGDTFAYVIGSLFGRHPLRSPVSPKKSIEGSVAGLLGALITAWILGRYWARGWELWQVLLCGLFVGAASQLGDLFESLLKRDSAVKDSGNIIPGHGGFLDRVDSLLFSFAALYYFLLWVIFRG